MKVGLPWTTLKVMKFPIAKSHQAYMYTSMDDDNSNINLHGHQLFFCLHRPWNCCCFSFIYIISFILLKHMHTHKRNFEHSRDLIVSHWTSWENENSHHNKNEYLALMILLHKPTILLLYTKYVFFCVFHSPCSSLTFSFCFSGFTHLRWWWTKYIYMQQQKKSLFMKVSGRRKEKNYNEKLFRQWKSWATGEKHVIRAKICFRFFLLIH